MDILVEILHNRHAKLTRQMTLLMDLCDYVWNCIQVEFCWKLTKYVRNLEYNRFLKQISHIGRGFSYKLTRPSCSAVRRLIDGVVVL